MPSRDSLKSLFQELAYMQKSSVAPIDGVGEIGGCSVSNSPQVSAKQKFKQAVRSQGLKSMGHILEGPWLTQD